MRTQQNDFDLLISESLLGFFLGGIEIIDETKSANC